MKVKYFDIVASFIICLVPVVVCKCLWATDRNLGRWAPHILGRILGADRYGRVKK